MTLPVGRKSVLDPVRASEQSPGPDLDFCILGVSSATDLASVPSASTAGFVHVYVPTCVCCALPLPCALRCRCSVSCVAVAVCCALPLPCAVRCGCGCRVVCRRQLLWPSVGACAVSMLVPGVSVNSCLRCVLILCFTNVCLCRLKVNMEEETISVLAPCSLALPSRYLIKSKITWTE